MWRNIVFTATLCLTLVGCANKNTEEKDLYAPIKVEVPQRPEGQEDMLAFRAPAIDTVRVGFVGLGMRGPGAVERFTHIPGTKIVALCDVLPENVEGCQEILRKAGLPEASAYSGDT